MQSNPFIQPPSVGWSVVVGITEGSPDLGELDFVRKKLVFLVMVAVAVFHKSQAIPMSLRSTCTNQRLPDRLDPIEQ